MIRIPIQGIGDGKRQFDLEISVDEIDELFEEFFGNVSLSLTLVKLHNRFTVTGTVSCMAKLICDRSLKEYEEKISTDISISFLAGNDKLRGYEEEEDDAIHTISDEAKFINITSDVCQLLAVNIPMKKIAPEYRDKDISDIYPDYDPNKKEENEIDERWSGLKKLKFN